MTHSLKQGRQTPAENNLTDFNSFSKKLTWPSIQEATTYNYDAGPNDTLNQWHMWMAFFPSSNDQRYNQFVGLFHSRSETSFIPCPCVSKTIYLRSNGSSLNSANMRLTFHTEDTTWYPSQQSTHPDRSTGISKIPPFGPDVGIIRNTYAVMDILTITHISPDGYINND